MQENSVAAVPVAVSGATTIAAGGITGNGNQTAGGGGGGSGGGHPAASNASGTTPVASPPGGNGNGPSATSISEIDQAQFEADKRAVYKHPLFSLLALLLEKCEQATQGYIPSSNSSSPNGSTNGTSEGDSFSRDVQAFVQMLEKEKRPLLTNNSELDGLMIKALQVLRIHLLELEKVQELCRDFCTRYIACLRGKMQSENLLRSDYAMEHNNNLSNSNSPINSPEQDLSGSAQGYYQNTDYLSATDTNEYSNMQAGQFNQHQLFPAPALHQQPTMLERTPKGLHIPSSSIPHTLPATEPSHTLPCLPQELPSLGQLPSPASALLNQIGAAPHPLLEAFADEQLSALSGSGSSDELDDSELDGAGSDGLGRGKHSKRGILPKHATSVMRAWLFQHLVHPYPTEDEKRAIAAQTNLTLLQVNNWFINARRRILQPMLDQPSDSTRQSPSSPSSSQTSSTVDQSNSSVQATPSKCYWTTGAADNPQLDHFSTPPLLADIENISSNISRSMEAERMLLVAASAKLTNHAGRFFYPGQPQQLLQQQQQQLSSEDDSNPGGR